ncbi:histidine kinase [Kibdelosporangium philippinense]|uniref:histidine kinase n=1 Tax=Kibdelosporangium philippinense TaxID=211113 RepID=A0ABS8ZQX7_9PSEU|nr:histidine kinase [Kibdelosporangium philippinense]MCE7010163.1 histidine kinase [Kibdelosporangium philippinense]
MQVKEKLKWWDGRLRLLFLDVAVFCAVVSFELTRVDRPDGSGYWVGMVVVSLAFLLRRPFPVAVMAVVAVGTVAASLTLVPLMVALYSVPARRGVSWATLASTLTGVGASGFLFSSNGPGELAALAAGLGLIVVMPTLAGLWRYQRIALISALRDRAEEAERNRVLVADQAVSDERRRIAREMHDVVAHRVTAIALQAGALSVNAPDERTMQFAETIRSVSAAALTELRGMLSVLRGADDADTPAETDLMASIGQLVDDVVATGAVVELVLPNPVPDVPRQVGRAVYRVVQESLTNAGKHAPHAAVEVRIDVTATDLLVEVVNRLTPRTAEVPGAGYGLVGMRERVELAGGWLSAGPTDGNRFRVTASFPLDNPESL